MFGSSLDLDKVSAGFINFLLLLKQARAVVQGDMAVIRLGSCGSVDSDVHVGTVVVAAEVIVVAKWSKKGEIAAYIS